MAKAVYEDWTSVIAQEAAASVNGFDVVCPFVKYGAVADVFPDGSTQPSRLLTRLNPMDMLTGVQDVEALERLLNGGVEVRALRGLHAKVFLSRGRSVLVGSANLTRAALKTNHEYGVLLADEDVIRDTEQWFDALWVGSAPSVSRDQVAAIRTLIAGRKTPQTPQSLAKGLKDLGAVIGQSDEPDNRSSDATNFPFSDLFEPDAPQYLVKILGTGNDRALLEETAWGCVQSGGPHWSLHYPATKRPRQVKAGAIALVAHQTKDKQLGHDLRIFGRVRVSEAHVEGRDDASPAEIAYPLRQWKEQWPRYVRVHGGQFLDATLREGVSVYELLADIGAVAWQEDKRSPRVVENPKLALQRAAHVLMSRDGYAEANKRLEAAFARHGIIPDREMAKLDWPDWAEAPA